MEISGECWPLNKARDYKAISCFIMESDDITASKPETKVIYHSVASICLLCVSGPGGPVHQRSYVPARLKVPSEQVILWRECVTTESNLPFLSQFDNTILFSRVKYKI